MIISEKIGLVTIQVGEPSKNHVRFITQTQTQTQTHIIEFHYSNWNEIKNLVDKMFEMADKIGKP